MMLLICGYGNDTLDYKLKSLSAIPPKYNDQHCQEVRINSINVIRDTCHIDTYLIKVV